MRDPCRRAHPPGDPRFIRRPRHLLTFHGPTIRKALRRVFTRKGFCERCCAPRRFHLRSEDPPHGTLLPAPRIAASLPQVLKMVERPGMRWGSLLGPFAWHDHLATDAAGGGAQRTGKGGEAVRGHLGRRAETVAAPAGRLLSVPGDQDSMGLRYCSDSRGNLRFSRCSPEDVSQPFRYLQPSDHGRASGRGRGHATEHQRPLPLAHQAWIERLTPSTRKWRGGISRGYSPTLCAACG